MNKELLSLINVSKKIIKERIDFCKLKKHSKEFWRIKDYDVIFKYLTKSNVGFLKITINDLNKQIIISIPKSYLLLSKKAQKGGIELIVNKLLKIKDASENIKKYKEEIRDPKFHQNKIKKVKKIYQLDPNKEEDKILLESFNRINEKYFNNKLDDLKELLGLEWSKKRNFTVLGSFDSRSLNIRVSRIFLDFFDIYFNKDHLDFIVYHELLHYLIDNKVVLSNKDVVVKSHHKNFKFFENMFENKQKIEKEINEIVGKIKKKNKK